MDLSNIDVKGAADKGSKLELRHPGSGELITTDGGAVMFIQLVGKYSDEYQKASRALTDRRLKTQAGKRKVTVTADQLDMEEAETLARCVVAWNVVIDGATPEVSFENAYKLFIDPRFKWVRDQAVEFVEDDSNFTN